MYSYEVCNIFYHFIIIQIYEFLIKLSCIFIFLMPVFLELSLWIIRLLNFKDLYLVCLSVRVPAVKIS